MREVVVKKEPVDNDAAWYFPIGQVRLARYFSELRFIVRIELDKYIVYDMNLTIANCNIRLERAKKSYTILPDDETVTLTNGKG